MAAGWLGARPGGALVPCQGGYARAAKGGYAAGVVVECCVCVPTKTQEPVLRLQPAANDHDTEIALPPQAPSIDRRPGQRIPSSRLNRMGCNQGIPGRLELTRMPRQ